MRILILSNFYPPYDFGGYEQICYDVVTGLQERGHLIHVLTSRYGLNAPTAEEHITRTLYLETDINYYRPADFFFKHKARDKVNNRTLQETISRFKPDLIFIWGMWNLSLNLPYLAETQLPGRVVYYMSSYWPADIDPHTGYWQIPANRPITELLKRPLRALALAQLNHKGYPPKLQFERVVCCSQYVRDTLVNAGKLPTSAGVIYISINPEPFLHPVNNPDQPLNMLYFGRLIHDKGVHTAIQALSLLKQQNPDIPAKLTILGSGHPEYEASLRKMVAELELEDHIQFLKQVPRKQIPSLLTQFNVFLFTSIWPEPLARSVMEAMAAGLLVIGSEVGGQTEMLKNKQTALTFQAENASQLAEQIAYAANQPVQRRQIAQAGQTLVLEKFTLSRMVDEIDCYLRQTIAPHIPSTQPANLPQPDQP